MKLKFMAIVAGIPNSFAKASNVSLTTVISGLRFLIVIR
jgi:hypothetical protein